MQIVILAAGRGTRMKELTEQIPKPMLKLRDKPILEYKLETLPKEITEVIFVVGYKGSKIEEYFGANFKGRKIKYVVQENLNGTGGALWLVKDLVEEKFIVMMGDDLYYPDDILKLIKYERAILACETDSPSQFGVFKINENGNLLKIIEKPINPVDNLINTGLYVLTKNLFDYKLVAISETEFGLPQTIVEMAQDFPVKIIKTKRWQPIGNPQDLKKAQDKIKLFFK
jgi:bifunctional UDP-N-acetylglucosamine pyrophosphorylase/glucosamine-1-phosphate N-acetyltransferase